MDQGKPTLKGILLEIQVEILRHLLRRNYPIKLCLLDSESDQDWGFGSLGISRASKHLSDVSLEILYGENNFKLLGEVHNVLPDYEDISSELNVSPWRKEFGDSRWSTLKDMPEDRRSYASSLDCLDCISQTSPGQERLRSVSVEMSYGTIMHFMQGLTPQILKRLRALKSLELTFNHEAWTFASCSSCTTAGGRGSHFFDREFLLLIKNQLGHIEKISMTEYGKAIKADKGPCPWIVEQLEKRNRAWTPQLAGENQFVGTTCAITTINREVLSAIGDVEYYTRHIRGPDRDSTEEILPAYDEPREVFY